MGWLCNAFSCFELTCLRKSIYAQLKETKQLHVNKQNALFTNSSLSITFSSSFSFSFSFFHSGKRASVLQTVSQFHTKVKMEKGKKRKKGKKGKREKREKREKQSTILVCPCFPLDSLTQSLFSVFPFRGICSPCYHNKLQQLISYTLFDGSTKKIDHFEKVSIK